MLMGHLQYITFYLLFLCDNVFAVQHALWCCDTLVRHGIFAGKGYKLGTWLWDSRWHLHYPSNLLGSELVCVSGERKEWLGWVGGGYCGLFSMPLVLWLLATADWAIYCPPYSSLHIRVLLYGNINRGCILPFLTWLSDVYVSLDTHMETNLALKCSYCFGC